MPKKILVQAGHQNIKHNSIIALRGSTGAPGEATFNADIANQVSGELRKRGFEVIQTDANANDDKSITSQDFDLALSIHYEADIHNTNGGFIDYPDPSVDAATEESQRIAHAVAEEYFTATGIVPHPEWSNVNTRRFYMWRYLTPKTPCVIIECGVGWRVPKDSDLLNSTDGRPKVVEGIVRGICRAFKVPYEMVKETPPIVTVTAVVTGQTGVNVRETPTLNGKLLRKIEKDQIITVDPTPFKCELVVNSDVWYKLANENAYVWSGAIKINIPQGGVDVTPTIPEGVPVSPTQARAAFVLTEALPVLKSKSGEPFGNEEGMAREMVAEWPSYMNLIIAEKKQKNVLDKIAEALGFYSK